MRLEHLEEEELIRRAGHEGDDRAFGQLVRRHYPRVFGLLLRLTRGDRPLAEDLTQEAFLRALRGLPSFQGRARFSTWVHRIAYFAYLNHRERCPLHRGLPEEFEARFAAPDGEVSHRRFELRRDLDQAVRELSDRHQQVLELFFVHELPYQSIAEALELPLGTVKTQLHRAKLALREHMDAWVGDSARFRPTGVGHLTSRGAPGC